jgi:hypothetical protein
MKGIPTAVRASRKRDAGVGESSWIDDHGADALGGRGLDPLNEFVLSVRLEALQLVSQLGREAPAALFDRLQGDRPVQVGLAVAEQVQVRPIQ